MGNLCFTERSLQFSKIAHKSLGSLFSLSPLFLSSRRLFLCFFHQRQQHPSASFLPLSLCSAPGGCRSARRRAQGRGWRRGSVQAREQRERGQAQARRRWRSRHVRCGVAQVAQAQRERSGRGAARLACWSERLGRCGDPWQAAPSGRHRRAAVARASARRWSGGRAGRRASGSRRGRASPGGAGSGGSSERARELAAARVAAGAGRSAAEAARRLGSGAGRSAGW
jgi:hypothetical protein